MNTILIGTDGSPSASAALDFAIELCQDTGAKLEVLAVRPHLPVRGGGVPVNEVEEPVGAQHIAQRAAERARAAGVEATPRADHGVPEKVIADAARSLGADLVIVGSRGLGTIGSLLMGSVSRSLVQHAEVPVTVVSSHHHREPATV
jgi:nucleotide-binding universal stress UspA family protein